MAFQIHDSVVRGEIDNRVKGIVRGKIWLEGREEPLTLELKGNAHPDLAGCLLTFTNPHKRIRFHQLDVLDPVQRGTIGDLTASRKVRVSGRPRQKKLKEGPQPEEASECMANALYLEWFSEVNGRVVIESADYQLNISPPEWTLTPEENEQRARDAAAGMEAFIRKLNEAIDRQKRGQKDPEAEWNEHDYERFLKESDARTDKYMELLDKYGDSEQAREKIDQEMGWVHPEEEEQPEDDEEEWMSIEDLNALCEAAADEPDPEPDPQREGIDWIRTAEGEIRHPLQHRCSESAMKFWHELDELGLEKLEDKDIDQFVFEFQTTGVKLAGALHAIADGCSYRDDAFVVAYLKRALDHLHQSQAGLEAAAPKNILPETTVTEARKELFEIREGILKLMDRYRGRV